MTVMEAPGAARGRGATEAGGDVLRGPSGSILILVLFLLVLPRELFEFYIGNLWMTPLRAGLILLAIPAAAKFAQRPNARLYAFDWLYFAFAGWSAICEILKRGFGQGVQAGGQFLLETVFLYLLVQGAIRNAPQVVRLFRTLLGIVVFIAFLAVIESAVGEHVWFNLFREIRGTPPLNDYLGEKRFGMIRVATLFTHPIHSGVFTAVALGFTWYLEKRPGPRLLKCSAIVTATVLTFSSGPLLTLLLQVMFIATEVVTRGIKHRFKIILTGVAGFLTFVQFASNRGVYVLVAIFAFSAHTAYGRWLIFYNGSQDVMGSPIIGIRPEEWSAPFWMTGSIDNFWLYQAMRGGIPSVVCLALAILLIARRLWRFEEAELPEVFRALRRGWSFTILAMCIAGGMVHFYDIIQPYFTLMIALGAAILRLMIDHKAAPKAEAAPAAEETRGRRAAIG